MPRSRTVRRLTAAILAVGVFGTLATAQPPQRPPLDPLAEARARQSIADQKAQAEVLDAIQSADRIARNNPVKAVQALRAAQVIVDSPVISTEARKSLLEMLSKKIAAIEGKPFAVATGPKVDPNAAAVKLDKKAAIESAAAEVKAIGEGIQRASKYYDAGLTKEADREIASLAKTYPNNPSVLLLQEKESFATRIADSVAYSKLQSDRIVAANKGLMESALPAGRDVEFPAGWKDLTARRTKGVQLSAKEKKIIEALDKPMSVDWNNKMLEEVLQELSTKMDQNLFIDKKSLTDLGVELNKPATLQANGVSARTVLRQVLAAQGLTFVVKDEAIQVVTVEKARDMLVTRVYYLGDLVQGVGPFGGAPQWGTFLDFQQTMSNADLLVKSIQGSIDPLSWKERGGAGTITFHVPSMSIIVRASAEVHATLGSKMGAGR